MKDNYNKTIVVSKLAIIMFLFFTGCNNTKFININCRPLTDYERIRIIDVRTLEYVTFDSLQYRNYLLSFSDTTNITTISGVFKVERSFRFDKGLTLIVERGGAKYEVIVVSDSIKKIIPNKYYKMRITPYFYLEKRRYSSEVRKEIYHKHHVIYPAYILKDEGLICTAELDDIMECDDKEVMR